MKIKGNVFDFSDETHLPYDETSYGKWLLENWPDDAGISTLTKFLESKGFVKGKHKVTGVSLSGLRWIGDSYYHRDLPKNKKKKKEIKWNCCTPKAC